MSMSDDFLFLIAIALAIIAGMLIGMAMIR